MRTKVLLCAAALAASVASSMADGNVYSINVVGYVNLTMNQGPARYTCFANPMDNSALQTGGNNLTNFFLNPPVGSTIAPYNQSTAQYGSPAAYTSGKSGASWGNTFDLPPGTAFMFGNPASTNMVVTFVGQVQQGTSIPVATIQAGKHALLGSPVPIGGDLTNSIIGLVPHVGDQIALYTSSVGQWGSVSAYTSGKSGASWAPNIQIGPGVGFLYYNSGAQITWTSNFTVQ